MSKEQCGKLTHYTDVTLRSIPQWNRTIVYGFGDRCSTIELGAFTKHSRYKSSSSLCATGRIQTCVVLMTANLQSAPFGRSGTVAYIHVHYVFVIHQLSLRWFLTPPQNKTRISYHTLKCRCKSCLCLLLDSNQRPPDSESGALSAELKRLAGSKFTTLVHSVWFVHLGGFEPPRPYWAPPPQGGASAIPPQVLRLTWQEVLDHASP